MKDEHGAILKIVAKLLAQKERLLGQLKEGLDPHEREEVERQLLPAFRYLCWCAKAAWTGTRFSERPYLLSRHWRPLASRHAGPQRDYRCYRRHAGRTGRLVM